MLRTNTTLEELYLTNNSIGVRFHARQKPRVKRAVIGEGCCRHWTGLAGEPQYCAEHTAYEVSTAFDSDQPAVSMSPQRCTTAAGKGCTMVSSSLLRCVWVCSQSDFLGRCDVQSVRNSPVALAAGQVWAEAVANVTSLQCLILPQGLTSVNQVLACNRVWWLRCCRGGGSGAPVAVVAVLPWRWFGAAVAVVVGAVLLWWSHC